jgi:hypothetical protein
MDARIFATSLIVLNENNATRRRLSAAAREDACYEWLTPTPMDRRVSKIACVVAAVSLGFAVFGSWLQ